MLLLQFTCILGVMLVQTGCRYGGDALGAFTSNFPVFDRIPRHSPQGGRDILTEIDAGAHVNLLHYIDSPRRDGSRTRLLFLSPLSIVMAFWPPALPPSCPTASRGRVQVMRSHPPNAFGDLTEMMLNARFRLETLLQSNAIK